MESWSVIVYGRTKEADYRFLAIPDDFGTEEQNWARKYIHGTTVYREKLPGSPRWSLFKNHKHCVFGVTCMAKELIGSERGYEHMAKDGGGRPLHIFVGYVAQINRYFNPLKILPDLEDIEFFKSEDLFTSLEKSWHLKDYQIINRNIDKYPYKLELTESIGHIDVFNKFIPPNFIPCSEGENQAFICPDNLENRQKLWENCCKFFDAPHKYIPLSLCLGLPQNKDVLEGPFSNATTYKSDVTQHIKLSKLPKRNSKVKNDSSNIPEIYNRNASKSNSLETLIKRLLHSISWRRVVGISFILAVIFFILLVIWKNYKLAIGIVMSLLIGFYLGIIFDHITTKDSRTSITKNKKNRR